MVIMKAHVKQINLLMPVKTPLSKRSVETEVWSYVDSV
jgi:hypothetical protein